MVYSNQSFIINATEESIAYFDSLDRNSMVYITTDESKFLSQTDERISGKFVRIEPNVIYYIRVYLISRYTSNLIKYVYPISLYEQNIEIKGTNLKYLYLEKGNSYILDFQEDITNKRLIKLSRKTLDTKIVINENLELNNENIYYKLDEEFKGSLKLEVKENDAFIELFSGDEDYDTLREVSMKNYEIKNDTTVIIVKKTQKDFYIRLTSSEPFAFSYSYEFCDNETYFYNNMLPSLTPIKSDDENFYIVYFYFNTPYRNTILSDNEFFSFTIKVEKKPEQKLTLDYAQYSPIDSILDEKLDSSYCESIINYLSEIFDLYIFTDIAKNPPKIEDHENYHHRKIDIKKELLNIKTENRYFYEFYQEVKSIIATLKDLHLTLYAYETPKEFPFAQYQIALPFNFVIKQTEDKKHKLFIEINNYMQYIDEETHNLIKSCVNIPLKSINDMDPFDYIQQFSKFETTKNVHAQFTYNINFILSQFNLIQSPFNYSDFALNDYEFENNFILRLPYLIPKVTREDNEFNKFYINYIKSQQKEKQAKFYKLPDIEEVKEKYLIHKGIEKEKQEKIFKSINEEKINWNITLYANQNEYLKCRVDDENEVNVVVQNTFLLNYHLGILKIIQCAKLFHTNNYPILIIESLNGGGSVILYIFMHQLFQMRTVDRAYFSFRMTDISKNLNQGRSFFRTEAKTCKQLNSFDDYEKITDNYDYNGESIKHERSKEMDLLPFYLRDILKQFREEYKDSPNLKKPTDIIIFTDSFSYSATSGLIKGFQNTGGAITVGYFGNPKLNDIDLFDASQSISSVEEIEKLDIYDKLYQLGFHVGQVTVGESFDDSVYGQNPIPREYAFIPVDYRVDIYSKYSDDNYDEFIKQGKIIHNKFNKENYCNPKNEKLLLHSDCVVQGKEYAHGGYRCNAEEHTWNTNDCQAYYCDIGYFYNQFEQKCMEECSFDDTKNYLIMNDVEEKTYDIDKNKITTFTLINEFKNHYYFYNSSLDIILSMPKIGFIQTDTLILNKNKNMETNSKLSITSLISDIEFLTYYNNIKMENLLLFKGKLMIILKAPEDHIFYGYDALSEIVNKMKYATYDDQMALDDILSGNEQYFKEYKNDDGILTLPKNNINILFLDYSSFEQIHLFLATKTTNEKIDISGRDTYFLFLEKDKTYELNFEENIENRMIKLSRKTLDSEIDILDENIVLNSNNIYYQVKKGFKGILKLKVKNSDAVIELLFEINNYSELPFGRNSQITTTGKYTLIKISKEYFSKKLIFKLQGDKSFYMFYGYSKAPYLYYNYKSQTKLQFQNRVVSFNIIVKDIDLMDGEEFYVLFENFGNSLTIVMSVDDSSNDKDGSGKGDEGLESWKVAIIVVGSILGVLIIIILVIFCLRRSNRLTNDKIEDKMEGLTNV